MRFLNWTSPNEVRKVTRKNIAQLFAALVHLMDISETVYRQKLLSITGIIYNRILTIFDMSATETISELKLVRRWFLEYIRGGNLNNPGIEETRWDDTNNCPFLLSDFAPFWESIERENDPHHTDFAAQIIFTLLSIDRIIVTPARPNHFTITDPSVPGPGTAPTEQEITAALLSMGMDPASFKSTFNDFVHNFEYEVLSTRGPNGEATWTAHLDSRAWSFNSSLLVTFQAFLEESGLSRILKDLLGCIRSAAHEVIPNLNPILGKLAYIEEWGGKARIVAQLDYWTQMAMTPLHHTINHFLRALPQDGTFNQHALADRVRNWTTDTNLETFCFDLTAATDRLPIAFQTQILTILMRSSSFATNWARVLTGREYLTNNGDYIKYTVGQPMGARSSFPMLALAHHVIIRVAALRANQPHYTEYGVLGDDSSMVGGEVAKEYLSIMSALGVNINLAKSITHVQDAIPMAEICKRVFMDGVEISRFNPKLIVRTIADGSLATDLQNDLFIRGWAFSDNIFWTFMAGILDRDNLDLLIKLNIAPIATTGLLHQYQPDTPLVNLGKWIPEMPKLEGWHLVELFTYITASEALKRLDALLRATATISDSLSIIAASTDWPDQIPEYIRDEWLRSDLTQEEIDRLSSIIKSAGRITRNHPIVSAARAEGNRISELLHMLNSHDQSMVQRARLGLLDVFRTSISSIWLESSNFRTGENRALFRKMLQTLVTLFTSEKRVQEGVRNLSLSYSVVLSTLARLWTVSITFGSTCSVNALRASITRNTSVASSTLATALRSISIVPSIDAPQDSHPPVSARAAKRRRFLSSKNPPNEVGGRV